MTNRKAMTKKGQQSIEFFILFSVAIFSFIFLTILINLSNELLNKKFRIEKNREIAKEIALNINRIYLSGNSSSIRLFIPQNYTFYYSAGAIYVVDEFGNVGSFTSFPKNITILKNSSEIVIRNLNGEIIVE
jgi:hypothetical protein